MVTIRRRSDKSLRKVIPKGLQHIAMNKYIIKWFLLLLTSITLLVLRNNSISVPQLNSKSESKSESKSKSKSERERERERHILRKKWDYDSWRTYRISADDKYSSSHLPLQLDDKNKYYEPSAEHYKVVGKEVANDRSSRFPSVEERIKLYMGEFYDLKRELVGESFRKKMYGHWWNTLNIGLYQNYLIDSVMVNPYRLDSGVFIECAEYARLRSLENTTFGLNEPRVLKQNYCRDSVDLIILWKELKVTAPLLMHYKDFIPVLTADQNPSDFPLFNKVRDLTGGEQRRGGAVPDGRPYHCILWPFNRRRHLIPAAGVIKHDIPWHEKRGDVLLWRGDYNVGDPSSLLTDNINISISGPLQKWVLVTKYINSTLVDAKYFSPEINNKNIPPQYIVNTPMSMKQMLQYKYLLSIEGHDMSSALKWMLFSNSLLFLSSPVSWDSWAMESVLLPFVHFIPVHTNMSNVDEMVVWAQNNPEKAKQIAYRGKIFIYDLLFHPDSQNDEDLIMKGIVTKYQHNFGWTSITPDATAVDIVGDVSSTTLSRYSRFPTVHQRVQYYMGYWYNQRSISMRNTTTNNYNLYSNSHQIVTDKLLYSSCIHQQNTTISSTKLQRFCNDVIPDFLSNKYHIHMRPKLRNDVNEDDALIKIIHLEDGPSSMNTTSDMPIFVKQSSCYYNKGNTTTTNDTSNSTTCNGGIIWQFDYDTEYKIVLSGQIRKQDKPFKEKIPKAFWRGGIGTKRESSTTLWNIVQKNPQFLRRLHFVSNHTQSIHVDAKFSHGSLVKHDNLYQTTLEDPFTLQQEGYNYTNVIDMNDSFDYDSFETYDTSVFSSRMHHMLSFKYIICLEDDYRSNPNLKWMLLSNSIVFMVSSLKYRSWFMEDQLIPYIHYIPIQEDLSNIQDMVQWCELHPQQVQLIRERANLYVYDLLFSEESDQDNAEIKFEIMRVYNDRFNF